MNEPAETNYPDDVTAVLDNIKAEVTQDIKANRTGKRRSNGTLLNLANAESMRRKEFSAGHLVHSNNLHQLNRSLIKASVNPNEVKTHRRGLVGKVIIKFKRKLQGIFWNFLRDYFDQEREFNSYLVRHLNETSRYVDERDSEIFWELIHKIDTDVTSVHEANSRMNQETRGDSYRQSEEAHSRINELFNRVARHEQNLNSKIDELSSVVKGLESVLSNTHNFAAREVERQTVSDEGREDSRNYDDNFYLLFENRFRGSEELIKERIKENLEILESDNLIEIGCGRGEFLEYCRDHNIVATGIDIERSMVELCESKNLRAILGDALNVLPTFSDNFFGGGLAIQVVEHLPFNKLRAMLALLYQKSRVGAKVILETPNPISLVTLANNYYRDPTHFNPVHPDTLKYLCELCGYNKVRIVKRSRFPIEAMLPVLKEQYYYSYAQKGMVNELNDTISRLNKLLYDHQDYAVIGEKSGK